MANTLEEIQQKITEVKSKIPGIKTGIEALSASDLSEGASAVGVPDIGDQDTNAEVVSKGADSTAGAAIGVVDATEQRLKDEAAARQTAIDEAAKTEKSWLTKLTTAGKTTETKLAEEEEEAGVAGLSEEAKTQKLKVVGLQSDINKLGIEEQAELDRLNERGGGMSWASAEANTIQRRYAREKAYLSADLYAEAAVLSVYSDNLTEAKNSAKDAVNAFMYDQEQEVKRFEYLYDYHSDFLDSLKAEDKAIVDEAKATAETEKDKVEAEKYQIMEWKMKYPNSGILLADTVEEATLKIEDQLRGQVDLLSVSEAKSLGVPYGTTRQDAMGLTPGEPDEEDGNDWDKARQFITDNPTGTYTELLNGIREYTGLSLTDSKSVLTEKGIKEVEEDTKMDKQEMIDWAKEQYEGDYDKDEVRASLAKYPKEWVDEAIDKLDYTWFEKATNWATGGWLNKY